MERQMDRYIIDGQKDGQIDGYIDVFIDTLDRLG